MNLPDARLNPHLEAALQRIRTAAEQAAERGAEGMGMAALSAGQIKRRDALLSAQFLFRKQQALFGQRFYQALRSQLAGEQKRPQAEPGRGKSAWTELSLMDDDQVDAMVAADRIGLAIGHQSEWELREVESYMPNLAGGANGGSERNPLRPELIAQALLEAIHAVTDDADTRQILTDEMTRALAQEMRACYADIAELFRSRGLRPQDLRVRASGDGASGHSQHSGHAMGHSQHSQPAAHPAPSTQGGPASLHGGLPGGRGGSGAGGLQGGSGWGGTGLPGRRAAPGAMGMVEPQMMELLRRLAYVPSAPAPLDAPSAYAGGAWEAGMEAGGGWAAQPLPPNLIVQHREELRQASTGQLDHMVIDVVGSLFDQILADPKVPPQMARLIAQLQLPVLRAALGDRSFFSSRRHPVRRFVNRIASLACAYDDFSEDPGREFLNHVRELVHEVATGDFERMDVYESKLDALEQFIAAQSAQSLQAGSDAAALVERKETDLRLQQRYMQQLQAALGPVAMPDFLRDFLAQVWSQAIVLAGRQGQTGPQGNEEREQRLRQTGRDLVMSVQPKGGTAQRQAFLAALPGLMRTLNEGLDLIAWPEPARKTFFGALLPAHAESLKGQGLSPLDYNLLAKQLDGVFGVAAPRERDLPPADASAPVTVPAELDLAQRLTPEEARRLGLVQEAKVDWNGQVDIDLDAYTEPPLAAADISIEGLPAAEAPEPSQGELLIEHLQLGFAYQMNTGESWRKVRLAHISAGRSFFIFTYGQKHQETVTMTARMLRRLCEAGRLKAFENAYLLERATARARKQLAELSKTA